MINLTTGIDAVVYGHFHNTDYREDILNAEGKVVPVLAGGGGEGLGFMKLAYDPATKTVTPVTAENGYRFLADQEGLVEIRRLPRRWLPTTRSCRLIWISLWALLPALSPMRTSLCSPPR